jgi:hypothetical protein
VSDLVVAYLKLFGASFCFFTMGRPPSIPEEVKIDIVMEFECGYAAAQVHRHLAEMGVTVSRSYCFRLHQYWKASGTLDSPAVLAGRQTGRPAIFAYYMIQVSSDLRLGRY